MRRIVPVKPIGIAKDGYRFFERHAMFLKIGDRLRNVPRKHPDVYTVIDLLIQSASHRNPYEPQPNLSLRSSRPPRDHSGAEKHERGEDERCAWQFDGSAEATIRPDEIGEGLGESVGPIKPPNRHTIAYHPGSFGWIICTDKLS